MFLCGNDKWTSTNIFAVTKNNEIMRESRTSNMARSKRNFETDAKRLISNITSLEEGEENFKLCLRFALSNFKYHRFLDVDSHKVTRDLDGICNKFEVHSQTEKSAAFRVLIEEFLSTPGFEDREYGKSDCGRRLMNPFSNRLLFTLECSKTDTHYSLLSVLLLLADAPTYTVYKKPPQKIKETEKDDFDWGAYLLEGVEVFKGPYLVSSDESDESEDEKPPSSLPVATQRHDDQDITGHVTVSQWENAAMETDDTTSQESGYDWLMRNVVVQYWRGLKDEAITSSHYSTNFARDWECYQQRTDSFYVTGARSDVTEAQLIREVLWLLSGVQDLFVFQFTGSKFIVRENLMLTHLSNSSLGSLLGSFTKYGMYVLELQAFVDNVRYQSCHGNTPGVGACQTYQAFTRCISDILQEFRSFLSKLESVMIKQEETFTLSKLERTLKPWLQKVELVVRVYEDGVKPCDHHHDNSQKASHLLSVLYEAVLEHDNLGEDANSLMSILFPMWIKTSKPYFDIIGEWIVNGNLNDPRSEFIIQRNKGADRLDEHFWETSFMLHCSESSPNVSLANPTLPVASEWAPKFLVPVLQQVILAGKSMEMLQNLGRLSDVVGKQDINYQAKSLYEVFIESLQQSLGTAEPSSVVKDLPPRETTDLVLSQQISQQMMEKGTRDPLLTVNFQALFSLQLRKNEPMNLPEHKAKQTVDSLLLGDLRPMDILLRECLYPHIRKQYTEVCSKQVSILKGEYHLLEYLAALRKFFLMEAGDSMFAFYSDIFDRIRNHDPWRSMACLNLVLHEAIRPHHPGDISKLFIEVIETGSVPLLTPLSVTDCIKLHYKVPWPVNVVINGRCQEKYNQIFSFLLQIKRSKYALDELRFADLEREDILQWTIAPDDALPLKMEETVPRGGRIHRMQILRMKLIYFVNSLHNYIMTRILHSTGLEFQRDVEAASDLDQIISLHNAYIDRIHMRCLLHRTVAFLKEAVMKVLNLTLTFQNKWNQGIDEISSQSIENLEKEYSRCIEFLASFLNNVIKRGSFPHLESLAFALVTSIGQDKT